jgi:hypothetical protein
MARGNAASEVLVAKAIVAGSATAFKKRPSGKRAISTISRKTSSRKASSAPHAVSSNFANGKSTVIPMCSTV